MRLLLNDSCLDRVFINGEMCVSGPLLTQRPRLTHFDNNKTAENEVSRSEVAVNEACKHKVSNDPFALLRVGIDLFNVFDTGINNKMPANCIDALAQLHGLGCTVTVLCSIGEHSTERSFKQVHTAEQQHTLRQVPATRSRFPGYTARFK